MTTYGPGARQAREGWYRAQQAAGLLPPFDEAATGGGSFAFANGFVSWELSSLGAPGPPPEKFPRGVRTASQRSLGGPVGEAGELATSSGLKANTGRAFKMAFDAHLYAGPGFCR